NCMLGIKTGINLHAIEVEAERVSIFHFPDNNISKSVYVFKTTEKSEARKFRMETNRKENKVKIFFGYTQVYEGFANFESVWKLVALARGDIFSKVNCFSELSVTYPELVKKIQLFEENK
ncbi:MAG: hypothetical protein SFU98_22870, partial [Leptospiraceae bacterium]|nr:hypothetical protein [Leptospiraceae bacterium]